MSYEILLVIQSAELFYYATFHTHCYYATGLDSNPAKSGNNLECYQPNEFEGTHSIN